MTLWQTFLTETDAYMSDAIKQFSPAVLGLRRAMAISILEAEGVADAVRLVDLGQAVAWAEKQNDQGIRDPVTGHEFTALQLMDQLEAEGKDRLGHDFSERRGYTAEEIAQYDMYIMVTDAAVLAGARLDELAFAQAILDGSLEPTSEMWRAASLANPSLAAQLQLDRLAEAAIGQFEAGGDIAVWAHTDAHDAGVLAGKFHLDDPDFVSTYPALAQAYRQGVASTAALDEEAVARLTEAISHAMKQLARPAGSVGNTSAEKDQALLNRIAASYAQDASSALREGRYEDAVHSLQEAAGLVQQSDVPNEYQLPLGALRQALQEIAERKTSLFSDAAAMKANQPSVLDMSSDLLISLETAQLTHSQTGLARDLSASQLDAELTNIVAELDAEGLAWRYVDYPDDLHVHPLDGTEEPYTMSPEAHDRLRQTLDTSRAEMISEIATDYLSTVMHTTDRLSQPVAIIIAAQPGAGSPAVIHELQEDYRPKGGFIVIDRELLRELLPHVDSSPDSRTSPTADADANHLVDVVLQEGIRLKRNLVMEPPTTDPDAAFAIAKQLRQSGYRVELHALAVNDQISYERSTAQFDRDRQYNAVARAVSHDFHDKAFQGASMLLRRLEFSAAVDRIVVYNRLHDVVYDNSPIEGTATAVKHFDTARDQLTTYERLSLASHWDSLSENLSGHQLDEPHRAQAQMALERAHHTLRRSRDAAQHYDMQFPTRTAESQALAQAYAGRLADAFRLEDRRLTNVLPELRLAYAAKDQQVASGSPATTVARQIGDLLAQGRIPRFDTMDPVEREWERLKKQLRDVTDSIQIVRASGMPLDAHDRKELTDAQRDLNDFMTKNCHLLTKAKMPVVPEPSRATQQTSARPTAKPA